VAQEIERKFLVRGQQWQATPGKLYRQGYLSTDPERSVRVRVVGDRGTLTLKGKSVGISRLELEYEIPLAEANQLLEQLCLRPWIEKTRRRIQHRDHLWEVDQFHGVNEGLVVAEVELERADEAIELPSWIGEEVSHDPRYFNSNLIAHPFRDW